MAKPRTKEWHLKRLYRQLRNYISQELVRTNNVIVYNEHTNSSMTTTSTTLTRRARIEHAIQTLENAGKK